MDWALRGEVLGANSGEISLACEQLSGGRRYNNP